MSLFTRRESRAFVAANVWDDDRRDRDEHTAAVDIAMRIPVVRRCVMLILDAVAGLPRDVLRRSGDGVPELVEGPLPPLIARPSQAFDWQTWVRLGVYDLVTDHNAFALKRDISTGWPRGLDWMPAAEVTVTGDYPHPTYRWRGQTFTPDEVVHLRRLGVAGAVRDPNPLEAVRTEVLLAAEVSRYGHGFFRDGAVPTAVLYSDQVLDQETAGLIRSRFLAAAAGRRRGPAVLGSGLRYERVSTQPNESQHLETREVLAAGFAALFGVPAEVVGGKGGGSLTYANLEMLQQRTRSDAVQPVVTLLQNALTDQLPRPLSVRLDTDALIRVDTRTRAEVDGILVRSGLATVNERRRANGQPPLPDGDRALWPPMSTTPTPADGGGETPQEGTSDA